MPSSKKAAQQNYDELKVKYLTVDRNYETLKRLARSALFEFEELKKKSQEDNILLEKKKTENDSVCKELQDLQVEYDKLKETSAKAFDQYGEMVSRYEKQVELKEKAESLATLLSRDNKVLKRNVESLSQVGATENEKLLSQVEEITMENSHLKQEVEDLKESLDYLTKKYGDSQQHSETLVRQLSVAADKVAEMERENENKMLVDNDSFDRLQKASEMALAEIESLSSKLETEQELRRGAERIAHQHLSEANALKRQSAIVMSSVVDQQQLQEALMEIETLSSKMSEMEKENADKVTDLQAELETLKESTLLQENQKLEEKLNLITAEAENYAAKNQTNEQEVVQLKAKVAECEVRVEELNQKLQDAIAQSAAAVTISVTEPGSSGTPPSPPGAPPPPPPPPPPAAPPPPPPPPPPSMAAMSNLIKVKKPAASPATERKQKGADPMSEMLERIKSGNVHLKKIDTVTSGKKSGDNDIMAEMSKLLASGRRPGAGKGKPPPPAPKPKSGPAVSTELAAILKKRKVKQGEDATDTSAISASSREESEEPLPTFDEPNEVEEASEKEMSTEPTDIKKEGVPTVKQRLDSLTSVTKPVALTLERKMSGKVKIPHVFKSSSESPLSAHHSSFPGMDDDQEVLTDDMASQPEKYKKVDQLSYDPVSADATSADKRNLDSVEAHAKDQSDDDHLMDPSGSSAVGCVELPESNDSNDHNANNLSATDPSADKFDTASAEAASCVTEDKNISSDDLTNANQSAVDIIDLTDQPSTSTEVSSGTVQQDSPEEGSKDQESLVNYGRIPSSETKADNFPAQLNSQDQSDVEEQLVSAED